MNESKKVNWRKYLTRKKLLLEMDHQCDRMTKRYVLINTIFILLQYYLGIMLYHADDIEISFNIMTLTFFLIPIAVGIFVIIMIYKQIKLTMTDICSYKGKETEYVIVHQRICTNITDMIIWTCLIITIMITKDTSMRVITIITMAVYLIAMLIQINIVIRNIRLKQHLREFILTIQGE